MTLCTVCLRHLGPAQKVFRSLGTFTIRARVCAWTSLLPPPVTTAIASDSAPAPAGWLAARRRRDAGVKLHCVANHAPGKAFAAGKLSDTDSDSFNEDAKNKELRELVSQAG